MHGAGGTRVSREIGCDAGLFPGFLHQRFVNARARRDAAADEIVEPAGIDTLVRTPAREPQVRRFALAHDAVDMDSPRPYAEPSRSATLDQKWGRRTECRRHCI